MTLFAVTYRYTPDSGAGRDRHRSEHLHFLQGLFDAGTLVVSGPLDAPGDDPGALLVIRGESLVQVDEIMAADPFAEHGFLERRVREWSIKFGVQRLSQV